MRTFLKTASLLVYLFHTSEASAYAPSYVNAEAQYTQVRRESRIGGAQGSYRRYLGDKIHTVFAADENMLQTPTIGLAISGGGFRAALYGAGVVNALDSRNSSFGGLLQSSTYISALSGGSWFLSSLLFYDFPAIQDLVLGVDGSGGWNLDIDLFAPASNQAANLAFIISIVGDLAAKRAVGLPVTLNDFWGRVLADKFLPTTTAANYLSRLTSDHGASIDYSSATSLPSYRSHQLPFPILVSDAYSVNNVDGPSALPGIPLSGVVYEMTPIEFGSFDPQLTSFLPMEYLGTKLKDGIVQGDCVKGFDKASSIFGSSSNLFHFYNVSGNVEWTNTTGPLTQIRTLLSTAFGLLQPNQQLDIAAIPNPFEVSTASNYEDSNQQQLRLLDGGMNGEGLALLGLLVRARNIDTIIAADATSGFQANASNAPTGSSLITLGIRASILPGLSIPPLPKSSRTFIDQGLNQRPVFFGCNGSQAKLNGTPSVAPYPLIIYLPNYSNNSATQTDITKLTYTRQEVQSFIDVTHDIVTRPFDATWATCLACATVERVRAKGGVDRSSACSQCFAQHCWNESESTVTTQVPRRRRR